MAISIFHLILLLSVPLNLILTQDMHVVFHILESQLPGTLVGNIANSFQEHLPADEKGNLVYRFLKRDYEDSFIFNIDLNTSDIYINKVIDREQICAFTEDCHSIFEVSVSSKHSSYFEIITVKVKIGDVNDNPPTFPESEITLFIPENIMVGSSFPIAGATDMDSGENNSVKSYELVTVAKVFSLNSTKKLDGTDALEIVVKKSLDREEKDYYRFFILAKDGGKPPLSGYVIVNVNITDENDNFPVFTETTYDISVTENTPVYKAVAKVKAIDRDSGLNGQVSYRLRTHKDNEITRFFDLNPEKGEIIVLQQLQYQTGNKFETIIEACDHGYPPQTSQAHLIIRVLDVGNDPPLLSVTLVLPSSGSEALLSEAAHIGQPIAHAHYTDKDQGPDGFVKCFCGHGYFSAKRLQNGRYVIQVKRGLDRETVNYFNVTITCADGGTPSLSVISSFNIRVTDENDNPPVFQHEVYEQALQENNKIPYRLMRVKALDSDLGNNAVIHYFLNLMDDSEFRINRNTGDISLHTKLDRETRAEITFKVLAIDDGNPSMTGTADIVIRIIDENDNFPLFQIDSLNIYVKKDVVSGTEIGRIEALDKDSFKNGQVAFTTIDKDNEKPFTLFSNGIVVTNRKLDNDLNSLYTFSVIAKDGGNPPKTTLAQINVHIIDLSHQSPTIVYSNDTNPTIYVPRHTKQGSIIGKIILPETQTSTQDFYFKISNTNLAEIFKIHQRSGDIVISKPAQALQVREYNLSIDVQNAKNTLKVKTLTILIRLASNHSTQTQGRRGHIVPMVAGTFIGAAVAFMALLSVIIIYLNRNKSKSMKIRKVVCIQEDCETPNIKAEVKFLREDVHSTSSSDSD